MGRIEVNIDINSDDVIDYEIDILEMESKCSLLTVIDSFIRLRSIDDCTYVGEIENEEETHQIKIDTQKNAIYLDYVQTSLNETLALLTSEKEENVLQRLFDLNPKDYACRVYLKDGTIAFKSISGKWYKYC